MEFLRVSEALFRSSQPLLPCLAPSAYRSAGKLPTASRQYGAHQWQTQSARRTFASSHPHRQPAGAAAARQDDSPAQVSTSSDDPFASLFDEALHHDKGLPTAPTGRTSRFKSLTAQSGSRIEPQNTTSSVDELLASMAAPKPQPTSARPASEPRPSIHSDIDSMLDPKRNLFPSSPSPNDPPATIEPPPSPIKLSSTVGRTIPVEPERGIDVSRAFRMLDMRCAQNSVRRDFQQQRFHERPGLKRKRLRSARWRRRFKEGFRETVGRVVRLKGQGW